MTTSLFSLVPPAAQDAWTDDLLVSIDDVQSFLSDDESAGLSEGDLAVLDSALAQKSAIASPAAPATVDHTLQAFQVKEEWAKQLYQLIWDEQPDDTNSDDQSSKDGSSKADDSKPAARAEHMAERRAKNRISARLCRQRKKQNIVALEERLCDLMSVSKSLDEKLAAALAENSALENDIGCMSSGDDQSEDTPRQAKRVKVVH